MKRIVPVFALLFLLAAGNALAATSVNEGSITLSPSSSVSASPSTNSIRTLGYSQLTIVGNIGTIGTLTNLYMTCTATASGLSPISGPVVVCDESSIFPDMDCRKRRWRWRASVDGTSFSFTAPLNYRNMTCTFTGDTPGTSTLTLRYVLSNN